MRFAFTDEQRELRGAVAALLAKECPPAAVRAAWEHPDGRADDAWRALAAMGVLGVLAPEGAGGLGLDEVTLVGVLEETGRVALPAPIVETAAVAVPLLARLGDDRLAGLLDGTATATVTCAEAPLGAWAGTAAVHLHLGADGVRIATVDAGAVEPRPSVDGARRLGALPPPAGDPVAGVGQAALGFQRACLGVAAQLVGLGTWMLDTTVAYVGEREQFGAPIGSFQAVKHHLADARIALEFAAPLVYRAAWSVAQRDPQAGAHVAMAKAKASDAALLAGRKALQCHGAIGYTTEHDLHLWMKRAWALARSWGDPAWQRRLVARSLLADPGLADPEPARP